MLMSFEKAGDEERVLLKRMDGPPKYKGRARYSLCIRTRSLCLAKTHHPSNGLFNVTHPYPHRQNQRRLTGLVDSLVKSTITPHLSTRNQSNTLPPRLGPLGPLVLGTQRFYFHILPESTALRPSRQKLHPGLSIRHWLLLRNFDTPSTPPTVPIHDPVQ